MANRALLLFGSAEALYLFKLVTAVFAAVFVKRQEVFLNELDVFRALREADPLLTRPFLPFYRSWVAGVRARSQPASRMAIRDALRIIAPILTE
jgi:hypothetical protein